MLLDYNFHKDKHLTCLFVFTLPYYKDAQNISGINKHKIKEWLNELCLSELVRHTRIRGFKMRC